jgi:PadR family transcriptional regulator, regulatory protein PadR
MSAATTAHVHGAGHFLYKHDERRDTTDHMKGERIGEFEELVLLAVWALGEPVYGVPIQQYIEKSSGRPVSMGAVYAGLERIESKGLVRSETGEVTRQRGGKRKRLYTITPTGRRTLQELRSIRERLWRAIEAGR